MTPQQYHVVTSSLLVRSPLNISGFDFSLWRLLVLHGLYIGQSVNVGSTALFGLESGGCVHAHVCVFV
jgi:hypothetical protein